MKPSTVGAFPGGVSIYGCEEMSGNDSAARDWDIPGSRYNNAGFRVVLSPFPL